MHPHHPRLSTALEVAAQPARLMLACGTLGLQSIQPPTYSAYAPGNAYRAAAARQKVSFGPSIKSHDSRAAGCLVLPETAAGQDQRPRVHLGETRYNKYNKLQVWKACSSTERFVGRRNGCWRSQTSRVAARPCCTPSLPPPATGTLSPLQPQKHQPQKHTHTLQGEGPSAQVAGTATPTKEGHTALNTGCLHWPSSVPSGWRSCGHPTGAAAAATPPCA